VPATLSTPTPFFSQPYVVRASLENEVGVLRYSDLQRLLHRYPDIQSHLIRQSALQNFLVLGAQKDLWDNIPKSQRWQVLTKAQQHYLEEGSFLKEGFSDQSIWFVQQGELSNGDRYSLRSGDLHRCQRSSDRWQVIQPTELYTLDLKEIDAIVSVPPGARRRDRSLTSSLPKSPIDSDVEQSASPEERIKKGTRQKESSSAEHRARQAPLVYFPSPKVQLKQGWQHLSHRYPFLKQQSQKDCGVACLVMIGRFWGKRLSVNQLRNIANVDRRGTTLRGLIAAAESVGFAARPVKGTVEGLAKQHLPAIAHWEGDHYVVVYAVTRRAVIIADPAIGRRRLSRSEFQQGWTGYTLLLEPTFQLKEIPDAQHNISRFVELLKPHGLVLMEVLLASILLQGFNLCIPLFTQFLLDRVIVQHSESALFTAGAGLLLFSFFSLLTTSLRRYLLFHTASRVDLSLGVGFIAHAFRLPLRYFDARYVGDITSRIQENRTIRRFLAGEGLLTVLDLLMVFVYFGLMFWYSWSLALLALVLVPLLAFVTVFATPFLQRVSRQIFNAKTQEESYLIESLTGVGTVKSMGIEQVVRWHWEELFNTSTLSNLTGQIIRERLRFSTGFIKTIGTQVLFLFGVWQVIQGSLTIGQLIAFNMLLGNVFNPFEKLITMWNDFQEVLISIERINDVLQAQPEENLQAGLPSLPFLKGHIRFEQVTFRYSIDSDRNTLEDISFEVLPGQTVAIVGRSGSGKTTLAKLLLGLYPLDGGRILVDGSDIKGVDKHSLRQQIGVVDQDTFLFGASIRDNIRIGYPHATFAEIQEAAHWAGADAFIQELPLKYDTPIGEGGSFLSGGQRQRLAIARALLGHPRLLILDEATSNLDPESEQIIQTHLETILKRCTTLVIAHRLSTVRHADSILVLDRGHLVEQGTHQDLMAKQGHYFHLNQQQFAAVG
jgi:ATP-binding cassette subfamily B protein